MIKMKIEASKAWESKGKKIDISELKGATFSHSNTGLNGETILWFRDCGLGIYTISISEAKK